MDKKLSEIFETRHISASAPCRIDMGGTLDIATFYYTLSHLNPSTFNIAVDLRTRVDISSFKSGMVKVSSTGFDSAEYPREALPFDHPMGLIFAIAAYFQIDGIHIQITSASPPKSAMGGSSAAAVALIGAFNQILKGLEKPAVLLERIPLLAHAIEESVAGVPCGLQDQLAATYGGINAWSWKGKGSPCLFTRFPFPDVGMNVNRKGHLLIAYCGVPHESKDINSRWVKQFLRGNNRAHWVEIARCTNAFIAAFASADYSEAARLMNRETGIRMEMTPDVLDDTGKRLFDAAVNCGCGARFTGAGGGGCVWALGEVEDISKLRPGWEKILSTTDGAKLLESFVDPVGLREEGAHAASDE